MHRSLINLRRRLCVRRIFLLIPVAVLLQSGLSPAQELAVLSRADDILVFVDLESGEIVDTVAVGRFCHEIATDSAHTIIATGSYKRNTLHVVDLETRTVRDFVLDGYSLLHGIAVSRDGSLIWMTSEEPNAVLEVDATTGQLLHAWPTQGERTHMIVAGPDEQRLFTANMASGTISVVDRATGAAKVIDSGPDVEGLSLTPDGKELWAGNRGDSSVSVVNTATDEVVAHLEAGGESPVKVRITPDGNQVWLANHLDTTITVFDRATRSLVGVIEIGERPMGLTFSPDGKRAYSTRSRANEVVEIDTESLRVIRRIPVINNPDGVLWLPRQLTIQN